MNDTRLDLLCDINPETVSPVDSTKLKFRYLDISAVSRGVIDWNLTRLISFSDAPSRARRVLREGDVLLCTVRPGLQAHARISVIPNEPLVASTGFAVLRPRERGDSGFIFHQLFSDSVSRQLAAMETGSNYPAVNERDVRSLELFAPYVTERARIATVLDEADHQIERTHGVIKKLKQIRTGLLHDLLTLGLDENGELRDPTANPNQFKESSLGKIPSKWNTCCIEKLLASTPNPLRSGPFGSALLKSELKSEGIPFLGIDNVHIELFKRIFTRFVGEEKYQELKRYVVRPNDIMITVMGTVGRCCVVPDDIGRALSSKHVWTVSLDLARYSPLLACWQINHAPWVLRQLRRDEQGGVMKAIRSDTLKALTLPVPDREEMSAIESVLKNSMAKIAQEECELDKLRLIKSGLMSDLLTGRVQVPSDLLEIVA